MTQRPDWIPIFPLPSVVFFPGVDLPLHIFEPRYREMTEAALEGDRRIGMVTVQPGHVAEMAGDPPVFEVGCAGRITEHRRHDDGRFDIVLIGEERFRIEDERPRGAKASETTTRPARRARISEDEGVPRRPFAPRPPLPRAPAPDRPPFLPLPAFAMPPSMAPSRPPDRITRPAPRPTGRYPARAHWS